MATPHLPDRVAILVNRPEESDTGVGFEAVAGALSAAMAAAAALRAEGCAEVEVVGLGRTPAETVANLEAEAPEVVVNMAEEAWGSDRFEPAVAYLLAAMGLRFTGNPPEALALARDKGRARLLAAAAGVAVPEGDVVAGPDEAVPRRPWPVIVKPATRDGSIGIHSDSVVGAGGDVAAVVTDRGNRYGWPVLTERYIEGRELNVAMVEQAPGEWLVIPNEVDFTGMPADLPRIVSYAAKWHEGSTEDRHTVVRPDVPLDPALRAEAERAARRLALAFGLQGYARFDARVDGDGRLLVIDINPNPDISPGAGLVRAVASRGIPYGTFLAGQVALAWRR